jgi:hypothetical protein
MSHKFGLKPETSQRKSPRARVVTRKQIWSAQTFPSFVYGYLRASPTNPLIPILNPHILANF